MYKIIKAEKLNAVVYLMVVEAPMVAKHCQPGQFVIVKEDDAGERIPLTICDYYCLFKSINNVGITHNIISACC